MAGKKISSEDAPSAAPKSRSWKDRWRHVTGTDLRTHFWNVLDYFEAHRKLRLGLLIGVPLALALAAGGYWGYGEWQHANSIRIARQWLDAGRLDRAPGAIQDAIAFAPEQPEPWRLASELAWRRSAKDASVEYAKKAATLSGFAEDYVLSWGEAAILDLKINDAAHALSYIDPAALRASPRALRISGEIARQLANYPLARERFGLALQLDVAAGVDALAKDEVPLGMVSLATKDPADRTHGIELLTKWANEPAWGAEAMRVLLADAIDRNDHPAMIKWAEALRSNPRCTVGDLPHCLQAVSRADETHFQAMLITLETMCSSNPARASELVGWLCEIGRPKLAVDWSLGLNKPMTKKPPLCVAIAEALRQDKQWGKLQAWTESGDWGENLDFIRLAYGMEANRNLGNIALADSLWDTLQSRVQANGVHALFAADAIYTWGEIDKALQLLWTAADSAGVKVEVLGTLARHYQVARDATGEFRAFSRLYTLRPTDRDVANNYAFFAVLSEQGNTSDALQIAKDNLEHVPNNVIYRSNYAFILASAGRAEQALDVLGPVAADWKKSPSVGFSYAITLGALGRKQDAKQVVATIDQTGMTKKEVERLNAAIN